MHTFSRVSMACVVLYLLLGFVTFYVVDTVKAKRNACEVEHALNNGCGIDEWLLNNTAPLRESSLVCDVDSFGNSWYFVMPLVVWVPLSIILPVGLFIGNMNYWLAVRMFLFQPQSFLILIQLIVRASVFTSIAMNSFDTVYNSLQATEAWCLLCMVFTFLTMDAMIEPTPKLRVVLAVALSVRFLVSICTRATTQMAAEQCPLLNSGGGSILHGLSATKQQQTILSVDWAMATILSGSVAAVFVEPSKMAFIRLRCSLQVR